MAEQIQEMGGRICTSCFVEEVVRSNDGLLNITIRSNGVTYVQKGKNVVHAWNGYGQKEMFLPKRLAE